MVGKIEMQVICRWGSGDHLAMQGLAQGGDDLFAGSPYFGQSISALYFEFPMSVLKLSARKQGSILYYGITGGHMCTKCPSLHAIGPC